MPPKVFLLVPTGLLVVACSHREPIAAETLVPANPPPSAPVTAPPPEAPKADDGPLPPAQPLDLAKDEASAPHLGASCGGGSTCGVKSRVSVRAFRDHGFRPKSDVPCKLVPTAAMGGNTNVNIQELPSACVAGDRLYLELDCVICRMPNRVHVEAEIAELTPQQLSNLQKVAALGVAPLRTRAAWEAAIEDAGKKARG